MEQNENNADNFNISLLLTVAEINVILSALGAQPHDEVRLVIDNVLGQATPQYQSQLEQAIIAQGISEEAAE